MTLVTPMPRQPNKVDFLPKGTGSLAHGLPPSEPGRLFVMGLNGGMSVARDAGFKVVFGRCEPDVHVCVGEDDPYVSRRHGYITAEGSRWVLHNTGRLPVRFPGSRLVLGGQCAELPDAYAPLFIVAPRREHLLEVRIATGAPSGRAPGVAEEPTWGSDQYELSPEERLVLVCLSQRYLRQEPHPQPLTWAQVADELSSLQPATGRGKRWTRKRAAHIVTGVRQRLSSEVHGLLEEEVPPPIGNTLNHNLIMALLETATITQDDLALLEDAEAATAP